MNRIGWLAVLGLVSAAAGVNGDDWPQWMGPKRDAVWRETGIVQKFPEGGPKVLWRAPVSWGYAGPAVAGGKVFVPDFVSETPIDPSKNNPAGGPTFKGRERTICFDATTGKELWKHEYECTYQKLSYPEGPRCTPAVHDGKVYTVGAEGNLYCLDAENGKEVWSKDFKNDYGAKTPIWGFCGHPLVEGDSVICIVGGSKATVVAFDRMTGKEKWKALSARHPGYSPPTIIEAGGARQLLIWDANNLSSLNPSDGTVYWSVDLAPNFDMAIMAPRQSGDLLFAGGMGAKGAMLKLASDKPAVTPAYPSGSKQNVYPVNMTPFADNGTMYGIDQPGDLMAVEMSTGKRLWTTFEPVTGKKKAASSTAFIVKNGDRFFLFNELGELIIAKMTPEKFEQIDRAKILQPTNAAFGRAVVWVHPAFANKCMFVRNDKEVVCVSLSE